LILLNDAFSSQGEVILTTSPQSPPGYEMEAALAAGSGEWVQKPDLPYAVSDLAVVSFEGRFFALGGQNSTGDVIDTVAMYDPTFDTVNATFTKMPTPRYRFGAAVADGVLYAVGGYTVADGAAVDSCDAFTFATHSWAACPAMSIPRGDIAAAAVGSDVFVFGGYGTGFDSSVSGTLTERLSAGAAAWTTVAAMPTSRGDIAAAVDTEAGEIYVVGGWSPITEKFVATVEAYIPAEDAWVSLPDMPVARGDKAAVILHHHLTVIGGEVFSGQVGPCSWDPSLQCDVNEIPIHAVHTIATGGHGVDGARAAADLTMAHWVAHAPVPDARFRFAAAVVDESIYTFGGHAEGRRTLAHVDAFYDTEHAEAWVHVKKGLHSHHEDGHDHRL